MNSNSPHSRKLEESEFQDWLLHPCTVRLREEFQRRKQAFMEQWAAGEFTDTSNQATAMLNAQAIGGCKILQLVLDLEYEDLYSN